MESSTDLIKKLQTILARLEAVEGMNHCGSLTCGIPASEANIGEAEQRLDINLPPSFRHCLKTVGQSLYFYYSLSDFIMPQEFHEIFSGGLSWDLEALEYINEITGEGADEAEDEEEREYVRRISSMLQFAQAGNGDIYAFDMAAAGLEKPVLYWEHETGEITYLAGSFQAYLEGIVELYCVGDEIWQLEKFLEADGINPCSAHARKWKLWFEGFLSTRLETEKQSLNTLFSFALTRKTFSTSLKEAFQMYDKREILPIIQGKLTEHNHHDTEIQLITMAAEMIGADARNWVEELWESITEYPSTTSTRLKMGRYTFTSDLLAYLSASCMEREKGFHSVEAYLLRWAGDRLTGWEALEHMKFFDRELVIPWMERQNLTSPNDWDRLFLSVGPQWSDMMRWSEESKKKKVLIDGLALWAEGKWGLKAPEGLPDRPAVLKWLEVLKEAEIMNTRKRKIDKIVAGIDLLYQ